MSVNLSIELINIVSITVAGWQFSDFKHKCSKTSQTSCYGMNSALVQILFACAFSFVKMQLFQNENSHSAHQKTFKYQKLLK